MPGPSSSTVTTPSCRATVHGAGGRAPLGGVVEQVGERPLERGGVALDVPRLGLDLEGQRRRAAADPGHGVVEHLVQLDGADHRGRGLVAGQLDEVADEGGQLLELRADVGRAARCARRRAASAAGLGEQVDVGAQRGERGAQLVAGVGDQPALPVPRGGERGQHLVERRWRAGRPRRRPRPGSAPAARCGRCPRRRR